MSQPTDVPCIAGREPCLLELAAGEYWWCACGRSRRQPFCDGSHRGTALAPVKFTIAPRQRTQTVWLCACKQTRDAPFCDGSHNLLPGA
jgi:CDGSH iron-sulfur domain-containing protein 3